MEKYLRGAVYTLLAVFLVGAESFSTAVRYSVFGLLIVLFTITYRRGEI